MPVHECRRDTPTMHNLVHGAYQWDWVAAAMQREAKLNASHPQLKTALRSSRQARLWTMQHHLCLCMRLQRFVLHQGIEHGVYV